MEFSRLEGQVRQNFFSSLSDSGPPSSQFVAGHPGGRRPGVQPERPKPISGRPCLRLSFSVIVKGLSSSSVVYLPLCRGSGTVRLLLGNGPQVLQQEGFGSLLAYPNRDTGGA